MKFAQYLKSGYPVLWVQTHEEDRAIETLLAEANASVQTEGDELAYKGFTWDTVAGLKDLQTGQTRKMGDPLAPINEVLRLPESSVLFLKDYHKFIKGVDVYRAIKNAIPSLKSTYRHIVIVSPVVQIPVEIEKDITLSPFSLPTTGELVTLAKKVVESNELDLEVDENVIACGQGLTLAEAENSFALSIVTKGNLDKGVIEEEKLQAVRKSGLLELSMPVDEKELGGMDKLKQYIHARKVGFTDPKMPTPRGILTVGLPGGGKSLSAKVIASILGYPLLKLDISSLKDSLVGASEQKMRQALELIDAISPAVVWIDEIEKALGGVQSSNRTDGGTTSAMFGSLLTWMQESEKPKFMVATCNEISEILAISQGALLRRFDDVFFVDLPSLREREEILKIMIERYGLVDHKHVTDNWDPDIAAKMEGWTGAEIEKFAKACLYDGVQEAFGNIRPIYEQNKDVIERARHWAEHNARIANDADAKVKPASRKLAV